MTPTGLFADIPRRLPGELLAKLLDAGMARIERVVSHGHAPPEGFWCDRDRHEWVVVLTGPASQLHPSPFHGPCSKCTTRPSRITPRPSGSPPRTPDAIYNRGLRLREEEGVRQGRRGLHRGHPARPQGRPSLHPAGGTPSGSRRSTTRPSRTTPRPSDSTPKYAQALTTTGGTHYYVKKEYDKAIEDYTEAIRLDPKYAAASTTGATPTATRRSTTRPSRTTPRPSASTPRIATATSTGGSPTARRSTARPIKDYTEAIRLDPKYADAYDCPRLDAGDVPRETAFGTAGKAVEYATKACELSGWKDAGHLSTLAAAQAEAGKFEEAVKWQRKAMGVGKYTGKEGEKAKRMLKLYEANKPYRDE